MAQKKENKKVYRVKEKITKKCKEEQSKINESEVKRKVRNQKIKKSQGYDIKKLKINKVYEEKKMKLSKCRTTNESAK